MTAPPERGNAPDQVALTEALKANNHDTDDSTPAQKRVNITPLVERVCRTHHWVKGDNGPRHRRQPLTDAKIAAHLNGGAAVGACPIAPGSDTTRLAVVDLDDHKGASSWLEMLDAAERVALALELDGYAPIMWRSSGGAGIHIYLLWAAPQPAAAVREVLRAALASCGFDVGDKGVAAGQVEVFPKQNSVAADRWGSMVVLPGAGKSERLTPGDDWPLSPDVPAVESAPDVLPVVAADLPELARVQSALTAIPNSGEHELSYGEWFRAICAIHHATGGSDDGLTLACEFSAKSGKHDEAFLTSRVWPYIRDDRDNPVTVQTLINMAQKNGYQDPTIADDFKDETATVEAAQVVRFTPIPAAEFASGRAPRWIIRDVMPEAEIAVVYGESGSGKSFWVLDMAAAVALGIPWRDQATTQGQVVYVAAEGAGGFRNRLKAYARHRGIKLDALPLAVIPDAPNLLSVPDVKDLCAALTRHGPARLVVVDTLAATTPGANENAGEDMGKALSHCKAIHRATGALVVIVHHSGKDATRGARGWSGIKAAVDAEIEITRAEHDRVATITKLKEGEDGAEFGFKLQQVPVGQDDAGEVITSCVVEHTAAVKKIARGKKPKEGEHERRVMQAVHDLLGVDGGRPTVTEVVDEAVNQTPFDAAAGKRDRRREYVFRALNTLETAGRLVVVDQRVGFPSAD